MAGSLFRDAADGCAGGAAVLAAGDDDDLALDLDEDLERTDDVLPLPLLPMLREEDARIPAEDDDVRLLLLLLLPLLPVLVPEDAAAAAAVALWRTYDAVATLPLGSTLAERVRLELRRRVPLALRAAARCVAEVGVDVEPGEDCFMADRPRLLLGVLVPLLAPMAPFLSLRRRGDLPPPTRLLVRRLPPDGSGSGGGGASFSPSERYMVPAIGVVSFRWSIRNWLSRGPLWH